MTQFLSMETASPYIRASLITITILAALACADISVTEIRAQLAGAAPAAQADSGNAGRFKMPALIPSAALAQAQASRRLSAPHPPEAASESLRAALGRRPANPNSWAQLAYLESRTGAPLSATANIDLERSFASAPFADRDLRRWRIRFGLEHAGEISQNVELALRRSLKAELQSRPGRKWFKDLTPEIQNPAGRTAAMEWMPRVPG